jgi:hypothetical protein
MTIQLRLRLLPLAVSFAALGCPAPPAGIRIAPRSNATSLAFEVSAKKGSSKPARVYGFSVVNCAEHEATVRGRGKRFDDQEPTTWQLQQAAPDSGLTEIRYGVVPGRNFVQRAPAQPLDKPGCYFARLDAEPGRGVTVFKVAADGAIREFTDAEVRSLYRSWK